ncbi:MAG: hypothetical protein MI741_03960 [Rhodospirillales bacterium]|nr:hypothetical protein [Rhodospirillales bacterium]
MAEREAYRPARTVEETEVLHQDRGLFGKVFILSLVEFYEAIGGRTGRLAESLIIVCETVFNEHMTPNDGFSLVGEDNYVFRFAEKDDNRVLLRAAKIIEEIGTKMLGESFIKSGKFKAMLTAVGLGDVSDGHGNIDADKVKNAVELSRNLPPEAPKPDEPQWVQLNYAGLTEDDRWAAVPRRQKEEIQWVALEHKPKKKEIEWTTLDMKKEKKPDPASQWQVMDVKKEKKPDPTSQWETMAHKKKASGFDWQSIETERQTERRAKVMQDGLREYRERRQNGDRRLRPPIDLGDRDRRSGGERRNGSRRAG